ncbi:MAG: CinA family protein [Rhodobacteraceae bacterium]|nr:CinA family protein [Paracoccaceae bacterium]
MSAAEVVAAARASGQMIALAESCTGGLLSAALTQIAGASEVFERAFITYSNTAKQEMLGVTPEALAKFGAVSEQVASQMAQGVLTRSNATLAVSVTGIAGPGPSEHKPEGRVCFGIATPQKTHSQTVEFGALGRDTVRQAAVEFALTLLLQELSRKPV